MVTSRAGVFWCAVLLLACAPAASFGQQQAASVYPSQPIRLVVPYGVGGTMDFIWHVLGQKIAPVIGQNLFVDNRGGAGGAIGTDLVAKSPPDGYTILLTASSHAILPSLLKSLPYDAVKDFTPITLVARSVGVVLVVHPSVPARTVKEFVALAKAQPGKLNYGSGGVGSATQFAAESFNLMAGTQLAHVLYQGGDPVLHALLSGEVQLSMGHLRAMMPYVKAGKLNVLGVTSPGRSPAAPEVPTIAESGLPGYRMMAWWGVLAPARTPKAIVTRLQREIARLVQAPDLRDRLAAVGIDTVGSSPEEFGAFIRQEIATWAKVVKDSGARVE